MWNVLLIQAKFDLTYFFQEKRENAKNTNLINIQTSIILPFTQQWKMEILKKCINLLAKVNKTNKRKQMGENSFYILISFSSFPLCSFICSSALSIPWVQFLSFANCFPQLKSLYKKECTKCKNKKKNKNKHKKQINSILQGKFWMLRVPTA